MDLQVMNSAFLRPMVFHGIGIELITIACKRHMTHELTWCELTWLDLMLSGF